MPVSRRAFLRTVAAIPIAAPAPPPFAIEQPIVLDAPVMEAPFPIRLRKEDGATFTFDPNLPAYDIVNLRVGLLRNQWDLALFVNNLTDETAYLALDQERGTRARVGYLTNQPRTIGISTRVTF